MLEKALVPLLTYMLALRLRLVFVIVDAGKVVEVRLYVTRLGRVIGIDGDDESVNVPVTVAFAAVSVPLTFSLVE